MKLLELLKNIPVLESNVSLDLEALQIAYDVHAMGAEQVGGLGNLLHLAVQSVNAAGQACLSPLPASPPTATGSSPWPCRRAQR